MEALLKLWFRTTGEFYRRNEFFSRQMIFDNHIYLLLGVTEL